MITETSNLMAIFGIAITLSAYLSAIRLLAIQKINEIPGDDPKAASKKWEIRKKLGWLTLADLPMVLSAFILGIYLLWNVLSFNQLWNKQFPQIDPLPWLLSTSLWLFLIAGTVMVLLHVVAWFKTCSELLKGNETTNKKAEVQGTTQKKETVVKLEAPKSEIEVKESSGESEN